MVRRILVVGTGDLAHGLCHMFTNNNADSENNEEPNYILQVAESSYKYNDTSSKTIANFDKTLRDTDIPIVPIDESIRTADIILLAIPAYALKGIVVKYLDDFRRLDGPVVVDCTNSTTGSKQQDINNTFKVIRSLTDKFRWVKAFNDNGFEQLIHHKITDKTKLITKICGPNKEDVTFVKQIAEEAFGFETRIVSFEFFDELSQHQTSLGTEWLDATVVLLCIFVLTEIYAIVRYNVKKGYSWSHLPLQVTNKAFCWTAIWGFALAQLPGIVANVSKRFMKNKTVPLNSNLLWWLRIRKHIGLISLYFLVVHVLMSLLIFNPSYYAKFFLKPEESKPHTKFTQDAEISFFFGILGFSFYVILGLCSLPSIALTMTSQQWKLMYGLLVWIGLLFGFLHVFFMGYKGWTTQEKWPGNMPPITLMSLLLPMFAMGIKLGQVLLFIVMDVALAFKTSKTVPKMTAPPAAVSTDDDDSVHNDDEISSPISGLVSLGSGDVPSWSTLDA